MLILFSQAQILTFFGVQPLNQTFLDFSSIKLHDFYCRHTYVSSFFPILDDGTSQLISRKRKGGALPNGGSTTPTAAKMAQSVSKDTLMPKETCPVCGIQITYKNLARHIKLRHKIKYKFCHKCRKFVPNDTYDDHRVTCNLEAGPIGDQVKNKKKF